VGFKSLKSKARDGGDAPIAKICRSFLEPGVGVHVWRLHCICDKFPLP